MAAALGLAYYHWIGWLAILVAFGWPFVWELITRRKIDLEGLRDIVATFIGIAGALVIWFFVIMGLPP
jgi:hypothetical protein